MSFEDKIRKVVPYTPGEQPKDTDIIKLNTNENPYPPSPRAREAVLMLENARLRLYPDPAASDLIGALSRCYGLPPEMIFAGVGSDDVLAMSFLTFFNSQKPILFPDITYSFYDVWAELFRIPYRQLPLDDDFCICADDYLSENGGIVLANPNAPTGKLLPLGKIEAIIRGNPDSIVIVDEAYIDFAGEGASALPFVNRYENVVVVRTFSKSRSAAGLRIGYAFGNEKLIRYLSDVKYSFNSYTMNYPSIAVGTAILEDEEYTKSCIEMIVRTREKTAEALRELGFILDDSAANFLFAAHPEKSGEEIFVYLKSRKIFVRWWNKPRISNYLRITVGTDAQMERLIDALREFLG